MVDPCDDVYFPFVRYLVHHDVRTKMMHMAPEERSVIERFWDLQGGEGDVNKKMLAYLFGLKVPESQELLHGAVEVMKTMALEHAEANGCELTEKYLNTRSVLDSPTSVLDPPANVIVFPSEVGAAEADTVGAAPEGEEVPAGLKDLVDGAAEAYSSAHAHAASAAASSPSDPRSKTTMPSEHVALPSSGKMDDVRRWLVDTLGYTLVDQVVCFVEALGKKQPEGGQSKPKLSLDELMLADRYFGRIEQAFPTEKHHVHFLAYVYREFEVDVDEVRAHVNALGASPNNNGISHEFPPVSFEDEPELSAMIAELKERIRTPERLTDDYIAIASFPILEYLSQMTSRSGKLLATNRVRGFINGIGDTPNPRRYDEAMKMFESVDVDWTKLDSWVPRLHAAYSKLPIEFVHRPRPEVWEGMDPKTKNLLSSHEIEMFDELMASRRLAKEHAKQVLKGLESVLLLRRIWIECHGLGMTKGFGDVTEARLPENVRLMLTPNTVGADSASFFGNRGPLHFCKGEYLEVSGDSFDTVSHKGLWVNVGQAPPLVTTKHHSFFDRRLLLYQAYQNKFENELDEYPEWKGRAFVIDCDDCDEKKMKIDRDENRLFPSPKLWNQKLFTIAFGADDNNDSQDTSQMSVVLDRLARHFGAFTLDVGLSACNPGVMENPVQPTTAAKIQQMIADLRTVSRDEGQTQTLPRRELALALLTDGGSNNAEAIDVLRAHGLSPTDVREGLEAPAPGDRVMNLLKCLNRPVPSFMQLVMDVIFVVAQYDGPAYDDGVWERNVVWCLYGPMNDINVTAVRPMVATIRSHKENLSRLLHVEPMAINKLRADAIARNNSDFTGGAAMTLAPVPAPATLAQRSTARLGLAPATSGTGPRPPFGDLGKNRKPEPLGIGASRAEGRLDFSAAASPPTAASGAYAPDAEEEDVVGDLESLSYDEIVAIAESRRLGAVSVYRWASERIRDIDMQDRMLETILGGDYAVYDPASASGSETGVAETGVAETGVAETGVAETGVAETGVAVTGVAETESGADVYLGGGPAPLGRSGDGRSGRSGDGRSGRSGEGRSGRSGRSGEGRSGAGRGDGRPGRSGGGAGRGGSGDGEGHGSARRLCLAAGMAMVTFIAANLPR